MCHCSCTSGSLLCIQVCSDPPQMHCSCVQGKLQSPLFCFALQTALQPAMWHCRYTYGDCSSYRCAVTHPNCTTALLRAKCNPHHPSVLLGSQQACVTAVTPKEICSAYRCAVTLHICTAAVFKAKCNPYCSVLLCKGDLQQAYVTTVVPMEICSVYRCAVTHHKCTAAVFKAKCDPHCSALLGKTQAMCHCRYTHGDCSSYRSVLTHPKCTTALFTA